MQDVVDFLKIKIEKAKESLPEDTRKAIGSVDWKSVIYDVGKKKGLSLTQTEDFELETELVLAGLIPPADYPVELEKRLSIPKPEIQTIIEEMNERVFKKIREELIKIKNAKTHLDHDQPLEKSPSILDKKLNQVHASKNTITEYSISNISKNPTENSIKSKWHDPYRVNPEE